jgi:hypothetical protein
MQVNTRLLALPLTLCALALGPATAAAESRVSGDFNGDGHDDLAVGAPFEDVGSVGDAGAVNVIYGSASRLTTDGNQLWHQDSAGIVEAAEAGNQFGSSLAAGDFNGDGFDDLAVGVPFEEVDSIEGAGAVNVIYGSAGRLTADANQLWTQNSAGIADAVEEFDLFGLSLTAGDFNGSGHDDLAIGAPFEDLGALFDAGAVNVIYGAGVGLRATGNQLWHQDSTGIVDAANTTELFGFSLTAGDFNGSGHDDLAVGVTDQDVGSAFDAGAVNVIYGSAVRLTADANQLWHQDSAGIADAVEDFDRFGSSLAAGDFNGSGHDDLAIGVPREDVGSIVDAGGVNVIYGAGVGLRASGNQHWHQNSAGISDAAEADDRFGDSLTAGDFNASAHDDLAVGAPIEDVGSIVDAGAVSVIYGSASRLTADANQRWHQDSTGIADAAEADDRFGDSPTAGDFNGSGHDDLAVGTPLERVGSIGFAGAVNAIYGAGVGLRANGNQLWHQDSTGIADEAETGDFFGDSLPT